MGYGVPVSGKDRTPSSITVQDIASVLVKWKAKKIQPLTILSVWTATEKLASVGKGIAIGMVGKLCLFRDEIMHFQINRLPSTLKNLFKDLESKQAGLRLLICVVIG